MVLLIGVQLIILFLCTIVVYRSFRTFKDKEDIPNTDSDCRRWFLMIKFWWCNKKKEKLNEYLSREKFDKLKAIENVKNEKDIQEIFDGEVLPNSSLFYGSDQSGNSLFIKLITTGNERELLLFLNLSDGQTYELPEHPSTISYESNKQGWSIGGLKISVCEPLKRWRITFNGLLRSGIRQSTAYDMGKIQHVHFNFIFISNSVPLIKSDFWSKHLKKEISSVWIKQLNSIEDNGFDQWGSLIGQLTLEDSSTREFYLRGIRQREWGNGTNLKFNRIISIFGSIKGLMYYFSFGKLKGCSQLVKFGHLKFIDGTIHAIDWINLGNDDFINSEEGNFNIIRFKAGGKLFEFTMKFRKNSKRIFYHGDNLNKKYLCHEIHLQQNKYEGRALLLVKYLENSDSLRKITSQPPCFPLHESVMETKIFVVSFKDKICQSEELVGGKGSSLASLTSIKTNDFSVPKGFCVTTNALQYQIKSCEKLFSAIEDFKYKKSGDLKDYCEKVVSLIQTTVIIGSVKEAILEALNYLKEDAKLNNENRYAVRSSAVGEDSEETSAAGQNSTFLGIQDADNVLKYVAHCWASLYTYQSVEYRRRQGLPIKASMGVCVQIMVDAEVSGVMFTRHPTTADPRKIVITSNYGLGESVVSAMVEPDTILLERDWNDTLSIRSIEIGKKSQKIIMTENSGTSVNKLSNEEIKNCSLSEKVAIKVAKVGLHLESVYQSPRDIEWAIIGDKIFLLQSRPITALENWTDFELMHELDSAAPLENDIFTFANVGEVLPGVTSPLTLSTFMVLLNNCIHENFKKPSIVPYCDYHIHATSMRVTINYFNTMLAIVEKDVTKSNKIVDVAVCGHVIITPEIHKQAIERNGIIDFVGWLLNLIIMIQDLWNGERKMNEAIAIFDNTNLGTDQFDTIQELYQAINESMDKLEAVGFCHNITSRISVFYEVLLMSILTENSNDLTTDHYSDIAVLLSSCSDVISAQVPIALREIVKLIKKTGKVEEFSQIDCREVSSWLKENSREAADLLDKLLRDYGHRSIKEMDFITETWSMQPDKLLSVIQAMVRSPTDTVENVDLSAKETVAKLKTPKKKVTRWILQKVVPSCRKAVACREMTKSVLTNMIHKFRLSYRKLAKLLVAENRIPDESLIFFLTHYEIGLLIEKPDFALVRKVFRRQRLFAKLEKDQFAELNVGVPKPLQPFHETLTHQSAAKVTGCSVYNGSVYARACVITKLSQAGELKSGDILITQATDIGWSPYFPLLSGVVTELGGLISHGAVVAREYGLPCIVGAEGATRIFKTGQMVFLNADAGTLEALEKKA